MNKIFSACGFLLFGSVGVMSCLLALVALFLDLQCYARPLLAVCIITIGVEIPMLAAYLLVRLWRKE